MRSFMPLAALLVNVMARIRLKRDVSDDGEEMAISIYCRTRV